MWRPPEKIRHEVAAGRWPSAHEARESRLFTPYRNGRLELGSRTWVPAMVPWRATDEGFVTQDVIDWYARFAQGKPGAIVVEATGIRDVPSGPLLRIGDDRFVPGLQQLVAAVREASEGHTRLYIQLIDFLAIRRRPEREKFLRRFLRVTPEICIRLGMPTDAQDERVRDALLPLSDTELATILPAREFENLTRGFRERVTDLEQPHIRDLPQILPGLFADAAMRAEQAGFDGVELHYAHAYTMASFLSALNTRDDGYGTDPAGRIRLPLEVFEATRRTVGPGFAIGCRMLSEDCIAGGTSVEEAAWFAVRLARAGIDFISLSRGGKFEDAAEPTVGEAIYPYTGRSGYECMPQVISDERGPFGRNLEPAARIRRELRRHDCDTPVIVAGGMHSFEQAEGVLAAGQADIVAFARQSLADPDWFEKVRTGQGSCVRLCKYTNYCEGLDQKHKVVTCQLWDREALDAPGARLTPDGKRRTTAPAWNR